MSILFSKIDKMMSLMTAESQFEIATLISDKYLHSKPTYLSVPKSKSKSRKKSGEPLGFYEVSTVDFKEKGFKQLVGAWCKEENVGRYGSHVYIVIAKKAQPYGVYDGSLHSGEKYAIVEADGFHLPPDFLHGNELATKINTTKKYDWRGFGALVIEVGEKLQEL